jgi:hypothetical protein
MFINKGIITVFNILCITLFLLDFRYDIKISGHLILTVVYISLVSLTTGFSYVLLNKILKSVKNWRILAVVSITYLMNSLIVFSFIFLINFGNQGTNPIIEFLFYSFMAILLYLGIGYINDKENDLLNI